MKPNPEGGPRYWRSLDELADSDEFRRLLEREFPAEDPDRLPPLARRRFLQLAGASMALAAASCRWETDRLAPFAKRPEGWVPGKPRHYATTMELDGEGHGLVVTSYDGRPIKVEGNEQHPVSRGATHVFAQAAILELYDPDRSRGVSKRAGGRFVRAGWQDFHAEFWPVRSKKRGTKGQGLAFLLEPSSSPARRAALARLRRLFPRALFVEYSPLNRDEARAGAALAFGRPFDLWFDVAGADVLLALDCDLFGAEPGAVGYMRAFADRRTPETGPMNRLYAVESTLTATGSSADHRLALRAARVGPFLLALEGLLAGRKGEAAGLRGFLAEGRTKRFLEALARDLTRARGRSLVAVGAGQPAWVHAVALRVNERLGNLGRTVHLLAPATPAAQTKAFAELCTAMRSGAVDTVFVAGGNPVYDAPADLGFAEAYAKVERRYRLGYYEDETSAASTWHLPAAHFLEAFGDALAADGTHCLQQPLIEPLFGGRTCLELLGYAAEGSWPDAEKLVRATVLAADSGDEVFWRKALQAGVVPGSKPAGVKPALKQFDVPELPPEVFGEESLELVFGPDPKVHDGRFANNGWLQELPDHATKLTWDNAALIAPQTAAELGIGQGDLIRVELGGRSVEIAAYLLPGQAEGSLHLRLGYGRREAGVVGGSRRQGIPAPGFDVYPLRTSAAPGFALGARVERTGKTYPLACTQDHFAIDAIGREGRRRKVEELVRSGTLEEFEKEPDFAKHVTHVPPLESLWHEHEYEGHRWAMAIDLSRCTACNACVVACQAENNIPVVGKDQVLVGREMHWIRIDRYFEGTVEDPEVAVQPMTCQQCELAPCEQVCPVAATMHSEEGLNDMVYNRCIGTRYCANNCPFKVRRFNYFNFNKKLDYDPRWTIARLGKNPEVSIRHRGVMEKCTFCVQRIHAVKRPAKNAGRPIRDGEIKTACEQACPTKAITFGDVSDRNSRVAKLAGLERSYQTLAELNIKPRTWYLARIRNPNPDLV